MICFIPLATGQNIPQRVYKSLAEQTMIVDIVPCCTDGIFNSNHTIRKPGDNNKKVEGEIKGRNLAVEIFNKHYFDNQYVAMCDRDIVQLFDDNFERAVSFLYNHPEIMAVALPWEDKPHNEHIRATTVIFWGSFFKGYQFRPGEMRHICATMKQDIPGYCYLPSDKRLIEEIE
jgi:hypothetical protein